MGQSKAVEKKVTSRSQRGNFIEDAKVELRRVTWPDRQKVTNASLVIVFIVVLTTLFVAGVDFVLARIANLWLHL